jgi:hypothetical protein
LNHRRAGLVAGGAADAAAVLGVLTLGVATAQIALAALNAVPGAIAAAQAVTQHAAEILQRSAGDFVFAAAIDFEAAGTFFEFDSAARQHAPIGRCWRASRDCAGLPALNRAGVGRNSR